MLVHQRYVPGLAIYSYVVADERSGEAAVIDPTRDVDDFLDYANQHGLRISHILETHVHADFVSGAKELKARLGGEPMIHASGLGGDEWTPPYADHVVQDGAVIRLGQVRIDAFHTPGHTLEHMTWLIFDEQRSKDTPWLALTGDFLFVGDVGRPDLLGKKAQQQLAEELYASVFQRLPELPDVTEVFPGHGAGSLCGKAIGSRSSSTVGFERMYNGALIRTPQEEWVGNLLREMPLAPPYFARMKETNRLGPELIGPELPGRRRWSAAEVYRRTCEHCLILDVRSKEAFAAAHLPGAINIPLGPNLPTWAGWVLPYDHPTLIVLDDPAAMPAVTTHLLRVGFDDVRGFLDGGIDAWETAGLPVESLPTTSVHGLAEKLTNREPLTVLDVRTEREWNAGHIAGAVHIHGGRLQQHFAEVPKDKPVAVVCGSGYRASIASSFLQRAGYEDVSNVLGGMSAWRAAGLDMEQAA